MHYHVTLSTVIRQPGEFFMQKNRQMKAGQFKIHSTNSVKILQFPASEDL